MTPLITKLKAWAGTSKFKTALLAAVMIGLAVGLNAYFPNNEVSQALTDAFTQTPIVSPTTVQ